ncbi:hypothetical protein UNH65_00255 [Chitinophaga sp. 180180018-2]|nr:hypothetical protein [Chitinophaga sp. 212800010-3]
MLKSSINSDDLSKHVFVDKPYFYIVFENIKTMCYGKLENR